MIREGDASVLISDWMMPRLDGPDLCRRIRAARIDRYIYIILLTSLDRREDRVKGLRAGADDFLTKPPDPDELAVRLEIAGRILAVHDQLARQNALLAELAATDELTGVKNRRRFREDLDLLFAQARPAASARCRWSCSTSTISRNITTPSAIRPATACSGRSARPCGRCCADRTCWPATAARSSSSSCRPRGPTRPWRSPSGFAAPSPTGSGRGGR